MSKSSSEPKIKVIELNKFYFIHDGSPTGHPGLIIWKDDEKNIYVALKFGTTPNKENILLKTKISIAKQNYIYKKVFIGKRKDFSSKALEDFILCDEVCSMFDDIKMNKPIYSKNMSKSVKVDIQLIKIKK